MCDVRTLPMTFNNLWKSIQLLEIKSLQVSISKNTANIAYNDRKKSRGSIFHPIRIKIPFKVTHCHNSSLFTSELGNGTRYVHSHSAIRSLIWSLIWCTVSNNLEWPWRHFDCNRSFQTQYLEKCITYSPQCSYGRRGNGSRDIISYYYYYYHDYYFFFKPR